MDSWYSSVDILWKKSTLNILIKFRKMKMTFIIVMCSKRFSDCTIIRTILSLRNKVKWYQGAIPPSSQRTTTNTLTHVKRRKIAMFNWVLFYSLVDYQSILYITTLANLRLTKRVACPSSNSGSTVVTHVKLVPCDKSHSMKGGSVGKLITREQ